VTSTLITKQSPSLLTAIKPSSISSRVPVTFQDIQQMTQENMETMKWKTLQLHHMNPPQLTPLTTTPLLFNQQQNPSSLQWMKIVKMLATMKKQKPLEQQTMTTAVKDIGAQSTVLTEAQKLCLKQFKAHHKAWNARNKRYLELAMARHYRLTNMKMALYLFIIHPRLYNQAMLALQAAGKQYPNPLTSVYGCTATNPKFIITL
jgi:hypothetical protein